ncbi:MAG: protein-S-isoprenylcysteine O-methyltransferase Ste14 [bacterium]|jgi:protein-S-isoprenylcysteine O-methyltransferase Ste14
MALREELQSQGNWLFRWRSHIPFILLPIIVGELYFRTRGLTTRLDEAVGFWKWELVCYGIAFLGLLIRSYTIAFVPLGTSGRNRTEQRADELNSTGIYSIVRNPLYLGNYFITLGFIGYTQSWAWMVIYTLLFWLYHERIIFTEEEFLRGKFGETYVEWTKRTPFLIPKLTGWIPSKLRFSLKNAIKREDTSFFGIVFVFTLLRVIYNFFLYEKFVLSNCYAIWFGVSLALYLIIRFLRKKTKVLNVDGR